MKTIHFWHILQIDYEEFVNAVAPIVNDGAKEDAPFFEKEQPTAITSAVTTAGTPLNGSSNGIHGSLNNGGRGSSTGSGSGGGNIIPMGPAPATGKIHCSSSIARQMH